MTNNKCIFESYVSLERKKTLEGKTSETVLCVEIIILRV